MSQARFGATRERTDEEVVSGPGGPHESDASTVGRKIYVCFGWGSGPHRTRRAARYGNTPEIALTREVERFRIATPEGRADLSVRKRGERDRFGLRSVRVDNV